MAASLRRQRRKKILENREARLRLILGEKLNEDEAFAEPSLDNSTTAVPLVKNKEQIECREHKNMGNVAPYFDLETSKKYDFDKEAENGKVSAEVKENMLKTTDSTSCSSSAILKTTETNRHSAANQSESQTEVNVDSLTRVLLQVVLASILVIYESIWKLKRFKNGKPNKEAGVVYQPNEVINTTVTYVPISISSLNTVELHALPNSEIFGQPNLAH